MCCSCSCKATLFLKWSKPTRFPSCECVRGDFCCGSGLCGCRSYTACMCTQASCEKCLFVMKQKKGNHVKCVSENVYLQHSWRQKFLSEVHTWCHCFWILLRMGRQQKNNGCWAVLSARMHLAASWAQHQPKLLTPDLTLEFHCPHLRKTWIFPFLKPNPFWTGAVPVLPASSACSLLNPQV